MSFNSDPTKMAQEVLFSRKKSKVIHPSLIFNGKDVSRSESHKHLGLVFDPKLNFNMHLKRKIFNYKQWCCYIKEIEAFYSKKTSAINIQDIFKTSFRSL